MTSRENACAGLLLRTTIALVALAALALASPALAADPKPDTVIKNKNIADKSSGLTFHYPPYAVGSYAEGEYVAFVPWETLKPYLEAEGTRIFGGARPKGDAGAVQ